MPQNHPQHASSAPIAVITEHLDDVAADWLAERCRIVRCAPDDQGFPGALANAAALVVRTYTRVDDALLKRAPRLRVVGRAGVGLDNIDVAACRSRGIEVVYTPDANTQAVVEYVLALLSDVHRPRITINHAIDAGEWNRLRADTVGRRQLNELTIGVLGLGRVGRGVARAMSGIGARVIYNDLLAIHEPDRHGATPVPVSDLFAQADVVSVHIDGRPANRGFVAKGLIDRMKSDVTFINTSRGFAIDNAALAAFMRRQPDAVALLDVHDPEPFDTGYPLLEIPNIRLYPHLASRTATAMRNMSWVVRDLWAVLDGRPPKWPAPEMAGRG